MDYEVAKMIELNYPYPLAIEYRRLKTSEYLNPDFRRLKQIFYTAEKTIHFLALIVLNDLLEQYQQSTFAIPISFKKEFSKCLRQPAFGKWIGIAREAVQLLKMYKLKTFISELVDYFDCNPQSESQALAAFTKLNNMRNQMEHKDFNPSPADFRKMVTVADPLLEIILGELNFLTHYQFLFVQNVSVDFHRWLSPYYHHTLAEVIGLTNEFSSYQKKSHNLLYTPVVGIAKKDDDLFIPLEPFIIYSDEGKDKISDIYLLLSWNTDDKKIKYLPSDKGGEFDLLETKQASIHLTNLIRVYEIFAEANDYEAHRKSVQSYLRTES